MRLAVALVTAFLSFSVFAHATVTYRFNGAEQERGSNFFISSATYLDYSSAFVPATGEYFINGDLGPILGVSFVSPRVINVLVNNTSSGPTSYQLATILYSINLPNTYQGFSGNTLTVSNTASVAVTPEPSSIALLGTGVLGVAGMARRRVRGA